MSFQGIPGPVRATGRSCPKAFARRFGPGGETVLQSTLCACTSHRGGIERSVMMMLADALDAAERTQSKVGLDLVGQFPPLSLDEAYAVQRQRLSRWPRPAAVWKVGASNYGSSAAFQTRDPFVGPISPDHTYIFEQGHGVLPLSASKAFQGEVEVVIRTGVDIRSAAEIAEGTGWIASVHLGIELPASRLDFPVDGARLPLLVADYGAAGSMVVGAALPAAAAALSDAPFQVRVDDAVVAEGGMSQLTSTPVEIVRIVMPLLLAQCGGCFPAGSYISTGGVAPCRPFAGARQVTAEWAGQAKLLLDCKVTADVGN